MVIDTVKRRFRTFYRPQTLNRSTSSKPSGEFTVERAVERALGRGRGKTGRLPLSGVLTGTRTLDVIYSKLYFLRYFWFDLYHALLRETSGGHNDLWAKFSAGGMEWMDGSSVKIEALV